MPNTTKKSIIAAIVQETGVNRAEAQRALETILKAMKLALASGRQIDLGKLGKLKVVSRKPARRINRNLKNYVPTIEDIFKKHPKTVRLLGGKDMSDDPKPTIVHKKQQRQQVVPARSRHFTVAIPSWRRRLR